MAPNMWQASTCTFSSDAVSVWFRLAIIELHLNGLHCELEYMMTFAIIRHFLWKFSIRHVLVREFVEQISCIF